MDFTGKVALVTGGSRGIGAATVRAIVAGGGAAVIHYGSNRPAAEALAAELGPHRCHLVQAELSQIGATGPLWADAISWKGQVDIVVNNAGMFIDENREGSDVDWHAAWTHTLQVNLISTADLSRAAINHWLATGRNGAIVNVASRAAFRGEDPNHWAYAASKGAMVSLTKTLGRAYSGQGIYTYTVAPGFVLTDMAQAAFDAEPGMMERLIRDIPHGAIAPASDVANAICFFASGLATHATGQTLDINGASYLR
jgi:3-oxoacyl-[acyl-carrier protein] reductase